tara:strand:+ start:4229 stop:4486 length:258 start_codon:yes stop_codon:yes gene_type:complete
MKLKILDKNAHWWAREKDIEWATQDKNGHWWIIRDSGPPEEDKMKINRRKLGQTSLRPNVSFYLLIIVSGLLGISLAINLVYSLM